MAEKIMHYVRQNGSSTDEQGKNDQFHSTSARNGCSLSMHNENRSIVVVQWRNRFSIQRPLSIAIAIVGIGKVPKGSKIAFQTNSLQTNWKNSYRILTLQLLSCAEANPWNNRLYFQWRSSARFQRALKLSFKQIQFKQIEINSYRS